MTYPDDWEPPLVTAGGTRVHAMPDRIEPIPPRTRVNVKRLANGQWQPDITVESFDADPLTDDGLRLIRERVLTLIEEVNDLIAEWEAPMPT